MLTSGTLENRMVPTDVLLGIKEITSIHIINSSSPGQNVHRRYFQCMLLNDKFCILIEISMKFVPKGPINNNLALV